MPVRQVLPLSEQTITAGSIWHSHRTVTPTPAVSFPAAIFPARRASRSFFIQFAEQIKHVSFFRRRHLQVKAFFINAIENFTAISTRQLFIRSNNDGHAM